MERRQSSFISKLPVILATIEDRKAELSTKKLQLLEAKRVGVADVKELEVEWGTLESEIDLLEHTANVMKMDLMQRGLLVVDDIKMLGVGTQEGILVNDKV
ncbi:hypothetical protein HanRHA438_Chr16g0764151 [Helianthus annuus]|uniref:Uncharacterized protein n=1 Tax=Helianthus annuus TaxID=4232 RepID=A0A251RZP2_HELAN|nr:hypothetical protein HanXRQr2_Chr16g0752271 [Helianthus annuus]KAJ0438397.1 hypothetical protein HanHA300_Chr16g0613541 [Helianthus annuus]KAJ0443138.1 hypothetical protein HanIR_Chr16g0817431 [Helianthus annuus]KAJ0460722.1 hypothetical protein HanHA89_Chr16g0664131 [Helianthus annuus]KAJ0645054.1 hypothetical protein HanOQP8_Chr16g0619541 [Helianthus annuus]